MPQKQPEDGPRRKRPWRQDEDDSVEIAVTTKLGMVSNTALAADLFGTMLRSVEIAEKRIAEERRNVCTGDQAECH